LSFLGASDLYRGLSEVLCEQGDLQGAAQQLQTAQQMGERNALTGWPHRLCVAQARIKEAQGDVAGSLALLDEAERKHVRNPLPDRPIAALRARTWTRHGMLTEALSWVSEQKLSPDDDLSYLREFEHLTLARVLIALFKASRAVSDVHAALGLLARLLQAAEEGGRNGSVIEILILQSLAHQAQGDQPLALAALERALTLAEPEGYVRVFTDEGEEMRRLIETLSQNHDHPLRGYADKLLAAFPQPVMIEPRPPRESAPLFVAEPEARKATFMLVEPAARIEPAPLIEALSQRELEVLRLLRSELSGPEIAGQLVVSLNTLRTHTKNIFNKLGVNNRRAAVRRAEELGIF
jgi:LuxR family maltose regulon positive regulatory protein